MLEKVLFKTNDEFKIKEIRGNDQVLTSFELIEGQQAKHTSYSLKNIAGVLHIAPDQTTVVRMEPELVYVGRSNFNLVGSATLTGNGKKIEISS